MCVSGVVSVTMEPTSVPQWHPPQCHNGTLVSSKREPTPPPQVAQVSSEMEPEGFGGRGVFADIFLSW
jgi:hypothetical protein